MIQMKSNIKEICRDKQNSGSKYIKTLKQENHPKSLTVAQKRACSSLAELSSSICEGHLQEIKPGSSISDFDVYSPWNNKGKEKVPDNGRLNNKRSTLQVLEELKKGKHVYKRKRETSKFLRTLYRHTTEPKQKISHYLNDSSMGKIQRSKPEEIETQNPTGNTYTSHHVLHITRPLKDCTNEVRKSEKRQRTLIPGHAKIEIKPYFKDNPNKENFKTNLLTKLVQGNWNHKALNVNYTKKKKLKRMFMEGKNKEKTSSNKCLPVASGNTSLNQFSASNPVSRTLLEKYLLLVSDEGIINIK